MSSRPDRWLVLVHGFLGEPSDWDAVIDALAREGIRQVIAVDLLQCAMADGVGLELERAAADAPSALPASRGASVPVGGREHADPGPPGNGGAGSEPRHDGLDVLADALCADVARLLSARGADASDAALCGYSLGGRAALAAAGRSARQWDGPCILMGADPGIEDAAERPARAARDDAHAMHLEESPDLFLRAWYAQPLFASLRARADFDAVLARRRARLADPAVRRAWARVLRACSPSRCVSRWGVAASLGARAAFVHGALDDKFSALARQLSVRSPAMPTISVPAAGHAAHVEQPAACAEALVACLLAPARR